MLDADPVATCMVASRVETVGVEPWRLGGELWGVGGRLDGLCFSGANLVPLRGERTSVRAFADRARRHRRPVPRSSGAASWCSRCGRSSPSTGTAREVRPDQPLMAIDGMPTLRGDPEVRQARPEDMDRYLPAAIAMFLEEVGVDPRLGDGGAGYRARVGELISSGRAFVRFENGEVVFKAEVGALSTRVGQIQGVWVHPEWRGRGLGQAGTAAVVEHLVCAGCIASLYVNAFDTPARSAYARVGFHQVASFATVLSERLPSSS